MKIMLLGSKTMHNGGKTQVDTMKGVKKEFLGFLLQMYLTIWGGRETLSLMMWQHDSMGTRCSSKAHGKHLNTDAWPFTPHQSQGCNLVSILSNVKKKSQILGILILAHAISLSCFFAPSPFWGGFHWNLAACIPQSLLGWGSGRFPMGCLNGTFGES